MQVTSDWKFEAGPLFGMNPEFKRVSTAALAALSLWKGSDSRRSAQTLVDEPSLLVARLTTDEKDTAAGGALDHFCQQNGIVRSPAVNS